MRETKIVLNALSSSIIITITDVDLVENIYLIYSSPINIFLNS